jgi:predicted small lipoprotein YifL
MILAAPLPSPRRLVALGATVVVLAASLTGCGSSAPASAPPAASVAAATPSPAASTPAASAPAESSAPSTGASAPATGADPAAGLTIDSPYTLTALPAALQQTLETQFAAGVGAFGDAVKVGFRQIGGGNAAGSILMVIAFPAGSLSATAYQAALAGMGSSMGATFETTTVDGVDVASGKASTGAVGVFHIGDHMLVVISPSSAEALPIATALIKANN